MIVRVVSPLAPQPLAVVSPLAPQLPKQQILVLVVLRRPMWMIRDWRIPEILLSLKAE